MNFRRTAEALDHAATLLESNPALGISGALRQVVWGTPDALMPELDTADSDLYQDAETSVESYVSQQDGHDCGAGVDWIPPHRAIEACRAEAARFRTYR